MSFKKLLIGAALVALLAFGARCSRDPLDTALPLGSTDLTPLEAQLARLDAEDRARVEAYVQRSRGDYVPAGMGDPDSPFTARTFAEAIALERQWEARRAQEMSAQQAQAAEREQALAPLRAIVTAEILRARIDSGDGDGPAPNGFKSADAGVRGNYERLRLSLRVRNLGGHDVVQLAGTLRARDRDQPLDLSLCYFEIHADQPLRAHEVRDFDCAQRRPLTDQERAFLAGSPGRFTVEWLPRELTLADGSTLRSNVY